MTASYRILVIDDEPHVRAALATALERDGFQVDNADSGSSGLATFQRSKFDLVIVDLYMPNVDGVKVIKKLRSLQPSLPVIAISGRLLPDGSSVLQLLRAAPGPASDVILLAKPFRIRVLIQTVRNALGLPPRQIER